jgi:eukaryotic translation initiation factor 2C
VLPPPIVHFREGSVDPKFSGRWNIQGKKLWKSGLPLDNWGFLVMENCVNKPTLEKFSKTFCQIFRGHGGVITQDPMLLVAPGNVAGNAANAVQWAHEQITARGGYTRLLFIVVPRRGDPSWERIKKSADCRQGLLSQVVAA